jgi:uncharacterized protein
MHKTQIIFIHGGDAFRDGEKLYELLRVMDFNPYEEKNKWRESIIEALQNSHESHTLEMPNKLWADYTAWSIWFEKMVPYLRDGVVLVGHSLGGGFLLRYLSEHQLPVRIGQLHLIAPVVLGDLSDCEGFSIDLSTWSGFQSQIEAVHVWHSADDTLVPIHHSEQFVEHYPAATLHRFHDRWHFLQPEFPELEACIKNFNL